MKKPSEDYQTKREQGSKNKQPPKKDEENKQYSVSYEPGHCGLYYFGPKA